MSIIHMENENYDELVKEGIVLVDFYAEWCGPCKMIAPVLASLADARSDINIVKVDVDKQEMTAKRFGILSVPTLYLYKDGKLISERKGFQTIDMLDEWIDSVK